MYECFHLTPEELERENRASTPEALARAYIDSFCGTANGPDDDGDEPSPELIALIAEDLFA